MADFSIASQVRPVQLPDQLQQYAQFNQLALHQAQLAEVQRAANEQNQLRQITNPYSPEGIAQGFRISPKIGMELSQHAQAQTKAGLEQQKLTGDIAAQGPALQRSRTEAMLEDAKHYRSQLNSALANPDDATAAAVYNSVLADVRRAHPEIASKWPERFDRATITSLMQTPEQTVQAQAAARLAAQDQMGVGPGNIPVFGNRAAGTFRVGREVSNAPPAAGAPFAPPAGTPTVVTRQPAVPVVARPAGAAPAAGVAPAAGAAPAAAPADLASNLLRRFEGFRETPYYDVNAYRTGYGSDTITQADGKVIKVQPGMQITKEDAERDLSRRLNTEFIPKATMQVGAENWTALPALAQAALASVAYNYGSLPSSVVAAVKTGDVNAIADAVQALKDNPGRRAQEAAVIRGNGLIQSSSTVPSMTMGQQFAVPGSVPGGMNALAPLAGVPAGGFNNLATPAPPQLAAPPAMPVAGAPATPPRMSFAELQEQANAAKIPQERALAEARAQAAADVARGEEAKNITRAKEKIAPTLVGIATAYKNIFSRGEGIRAEGDQTFAKRAEIGLKAALPSSVTTVLSPKTGSDIATIENLRRDLLPTIAEMTGAKSLDAVAEMKSILNSLTTPGQTDATIVATLNNFGKKYGLGELLSLEDLRPAGQNAPGAASESGVPRGRRGAAPAAPAAATAAASAWPAVTPAASAQLKSNPSTTAQFDEIFGPGAAAKVLGR